MIRTVHDHTKGRQILENIPCASENIIMCTPFLSVATITCLPSSFCELLSYFQFCSCGKSDVLLPFTWRHNKPFDLFLITSFLLSHLPGLVSAFGLREIILSFLSLLMVVLCQGAFLYSDSTHLGSRHRENLFLWACHKRRKIYAFIFSWNCQQVQ